MCLAVLVVTLLAEQWQWLGEKSFSLAHHYANRFVKHCTVIAEQILGYAEKADLSRKTSMKASRIGNSAI